METNLFRYPFSIVHYFIPEFIYRMRNNGDVLDKPSPRQSFAICNLLLPSFLRKGYLTFQDLVDVAVYTSKIDNQEIAERLASEILLNGGEPEGESARNDLENILGLLSQKSDDLTSYWFVDRSDTNRVETQNIQDSYIDAFKDLTNLPDVGVGLGEDELIKMIIRKRKRDKEAVYNRVLKDFLKIKLLKFGRDFKRTIDTLEKPLLKPFEPGDDPDLIDEERSFENIFDQGKAMEDVRYDDFFVRKKIRRKRDIVYILDISNTMFYEMEGLTSIHFSVMSLVPLIWGFRRDRYGFIYYESNSHIRKEIHEDADAGLIVDDLLDLITSTTDDVEKRIRGTKGSRIWGGTVPKGSLNWAFNKLYELESRNEKICFYFSDFVLEDRGAAEIKNSDSYVIIKKMLDHGIKVFACFSPLARGRIFNQYTKNVLEWLNKAGCILIETHKPTSFLENVQNYISST